MLQRVARFAELLDLSLEEQMALGGFETKSANGRPLGEPAFIAMIEARLGRSLRKGRPGPRPGAAKRHGE